MDVGLILGSFHSKIGRVGAEGKIICKSGAGGVSATILCLVGFFHINLKLIHITCQLLYLSTPVSVFGRRNYKHPIPFP